MKNVLTIPFLLLSISLFAQLTDNFDSKDFPNNPTWSGDVADFMVNDQGELQLSADGGGSSSIFSTISPSSTDTTSFSIKFRLDFSPSGGNALKIFLALDDTNLETASGYYLDMGESGSNDAIKFFHLESGKATELASGTLGAVATKPHVNLRVDAYPSGAWVMNVDYDGGTLLKEDIVVQDQSFDINTAKYFGLNCKYTSSRSKLFFFDDISVRPFEQDETPPAVSEVTVVDGNTIRVEFSEPIQDPAITQFAIDETYPSKVVVSNNQIAILTFDTTFRSDMSFTLTISDIVDLNNNKISESTTLTLNYARPAQSGDILINEILFAPTVTKGDFVELRNITSDYLDLSGYVLGNDTRSTDARKEIPKNIILAPKQFLAFTENKEGIVDLYKPRYPENIVEIDIPGYNNDEGNVFLSKPDSTVLDSYDYNEDQHLKLLLSVRGVSLERTSPSLPTSDPNAWTSAASTVNFATPGYENSATLRDVQTDNEFELLQKVFSPNADNIDDLMILGYNLDKSGYIANIEIRDAAGFLVRRLAQNATLSTKGIITWDGLDQNGNLANVGMYIVLGEVLHTDGSRKSVKKVCVLANKLN